MYSAALSSSSLAFRPLAAANPRTKKRPPKNPNLKPRRSSSGAGGVAGGGGGEATTYTSLPPRDDFPLASIAGISAENAAEIKLRESPISGLDLNEGKRGRRSGKRGHGGKGKGGIFVEDIDELDDLGLGFEVLADGLGGKRSFGVGGGRGGGNRGKGLIFEGEVEGVDDSGGNELSGRVARKGFGRREKRYVSFGDVEGGGEDGEVLSSMSSSGRVVFGGSKQHSVHFVDEKVDGDEGGDFMEIGDFDELSFESDDDGDGENDVILGYGSDNVEEEEEEEEEESESDEDFEGFVDGDDVFDAAKVKEKGIPAVMRCFDRTKIYVKAGDGGNGVVAFRREKFVPLGGPSGGDGGRGGNVYVEVDKAMNSLLPFRKSVHFRADRGGHGHGSKQAGAKGADVVVKVPPGTVIREALKGGMTGEVLLELMHPGQRALLLPGGRGGRGNASFKSGTNKVPKFAEKGEEGPEM